MSEWISVTDRLPRPNLRVIVVDNTNLIQEGSYHVPSFKPPFWHTSLLRYDEKLRNRAVTHWMPLPDPPNNMEEQKPVSITYQLECDKCKKSIWIGQRDYIYTNDEKVMNNLEQFLFDHLNHKLEFRSDYTSKYMMAYDDEWEQIGRDT